MFADVEADVYVIVDGDDTYDAAEASRLISILLDNQLDMVNARRVTDAAEAYRAGRMDWTNKLLSSMVYYGLRQSIPGRIIRLSGAVAPIC